MDFLTQDKNDMEVKQICLHFPCVNVIELNDSLLDKKIGDSQNLYVDSRIEINSDSRLQLLLMAKEYILLENEGCLYKQTKVRCELE